MLITKKNQYALRAIFELAKHDGKGPQKISEIAKAQAIPEKFLEVILNQLKGSGLVDSKRGFYGGYYLIRSPEKITDVAPDALSAVTNPNPPTRDFYGFAKPGDSSLPLPIEEYLSKPIDAFEGNDRNIATLARYYNGRLETSTDAE